MHLLVTLEGEIETAQHQKRRDGLGEEGAEQERCREQEQELVAERADRNAPVDRQLALRGEAGDVARGHCRIVDDDTGRLGARLHRLSRRVVQRSRGELGQGDHVVQQRQQAAHSAIPR